MILEIIKLVKANAAGLGVVGIILALGLWAFVRFNARDRMANWFKPVMFGIGKMYSSWLLRLPIPTSLAEDIEEGFVASVLYILRMCCTWFEEGMLSDNSKKEPVYGQVDKQV